MPRALSRLALGRGGPRDLACVRDGLLAGARARARTRHRPADLPRSCASAARSACRACAGGRRQARLALADELPLLKRDGGFMRAGFDPNLDELRELQRGFAPLHRGAAERATRRRPAAARCSVKHNHMIGYFVEVPQKWARISDDEPFEGHLHPPPDHGGRHALLDHGTR